MKGKALPISCVGTGPEPNEAGLYSKKFMIESTSLCNLRCRLCPVSYRLRRATGHMHPNTFKKVIDDIADYAKKIDLWNYGEPLLNPDIFDMIRYATDRYIHVRVSTNSTLLGDEEIGEVFRSNLSSIIVCLDGATRETHEFYRIGSDFTKAVAGISKLAHRKQVEKRETPFIRLQFIVFSHNEHEISQILAEAERMGVDQLCLKKASVGAWINAGGCKEAACSFLPKDERHQRYETRDSELKPKRLGAPCSWAYKNGVVLSNGDVTTCCADSSGKHVFANVHRDGGLMNILASDRMRELRERMIKLELPLCKTCHYSDYTKTLHDFSLGTER